MTQDDTDDLLVQALEPGEKIVWSDRPHRISSSALHMLWHRLTTWTSLISAIFLALVVGVFVSVKDRAQTGALSAFSWEGLGVPIVLGLAALPLIFETFRFLHRVARTAAHRYAVTDRGRAIFVMPHVVGTFELPRAEVMKTTASGTAEHGDIELGIREVVERSQGGTKKALRTVVFRDVSYPLIALESIRAAARREGGSGQPPLLT